VLQWDEPCWWWRSSLLGLLPEPARCCPTRPATPSSRCQGAARVAESQDHAWTAAAFPLSHSPSASPALAAGTLQSPPPFGVGFRSFGHPGCAHGRSQQWDCWCGRDRQGVTSTGWQAPLQDNSGCHGYRWKTGLRVNSGQYRGKHSIPRRSVHTWDGGSRSGNQHRPPSPHPALSLQVKLPKASRREIKVCNGLRSGTGLGANRPPVRLWPVGRGGFSFPSTLPWWGPIWSTLSSSGLPSSRKMRSYWRESSGGLWGWGGDWSISPTRRGW